MGRKPLWKHFDYSYNLQSALCVSIAPRDSKKALTVMSDKLRNFGE